jgi:hypothetical protein
MDAPMLWDMLPEQDRPAIVVKPTSRMMARLVTEGVSPVQSAADEFGFALQMHDVEGEMFYSVQDWMRGVMQKDDVRSDWRHLQKRADQLLKSVQQLDYVAENGKTYQMGFADAETIALITMRMKADTGIRDAVLAYLAKATAFFEKLMRNPELGGSFLHSISDRRQYTALIAGGSSHEDAVKWLEVRASQRQPRNSITANWSRRNVTRRDFATLTNKVTVVATGKTATQHKRDLAVSNPRDHLSAAENAAIAGVEMFSGMLHDRNNSQGVDELSADIENSVQFLNLDAINAAFSHKRLLTGGAE